METLMHFSEPRMHLCGCAWWVCLWRFFICEISVTSISYFLFWHSFCCALVFVWPYSFMCAGHGALVALHLRKSGNFAEIKRLYFMAIRMLAASFAPLFCVFFSSLRDVNRIFLLVRDSTSGEKAVKSSSYHRKNIWIFSLFLCHLTALF